MHELAITEGLLKTVLPPAEKAGAVRILKIRLKVGEMSGIVPECIQQYLDLLCKDTIAQGVKLETELVPVSLICRSCGWSGTIQGKEYTCPVCDSMNLKIVTGRDYYVENIEIE